MFHRDGLVSAALHKVDGIDRVIAASETLLNISGTAESLGVTRLADITGLDRVGIPVYAAVAPKSDDIISVYNGKGRRPIDAKVGALMEAIERQTALRARLPIVEGSFANLSRSCNVLDPTSVNRELSEDYSEHGCYQWVQGIDIVTDATVLVPADLAGYRWHDSLPRRCFRRSDANGLASGNCREEAICHALCELVERDAWTMAEIGAHQMPRARRSLAFGADARNGSDDLDLFPTIDADENELVQKFYAADLFPVIHLITSEIGLPTIIAAVAEECMPGFPMVHAGLGTHPDANVALIRALTELAQSRCVDIQGVREDLKLSTIAPTGLPTHTKRASAIDPTSWLIGQSENRTQMNEVVSHKFGAIQEDIAFLIDRLVASDLKQIIVVEFPSRCAGCSVVRAIVPGTEFWAIGQRRLGPRALAFWRSHV